jgi:hypothetical protein
VVYYCFGRAGITGSASARTLILIIIIIHCELLCNQLYRTPEILKYIMLKIVPIDGIGLSCVALEMSHTLLML